MEVRKKEAGCKKKRDQRKKKEEGRGKSKPSQAETASLI